MRYICSRTLLVAALTSLESTAVECSKYTLEARHSRIANGIEHGEMLELKAKVSLVVGDFGTQESAQRIKIGPG